MIGFARHSIFAFSIGIPISVVVSLSSCRLQIQMYHREILLLQLCLDSVRHELCWVRHFCFHFLHPLRRFSFSIVAIISRICMYPSSPSSFIFAMVVFIPGSWVPTVSVIVCRTFHLFIKLCQSFICILRVNFHFSSDLLSASIILRTPHLHLVSSIYLHTFPPTSFSSLFLLLIRMSINSLFPFLLIYSKTFQS